MVGRGNKLALDSAPHGAGRVHSLAAGRRAFSGEDLPAGGDGRHRATRHRRLYKDLDRVMEDAEDLVEVRHTLQHIVNVKGD